MSLKSDQLELGFSIYAETSLFAYWSSVGTRVSNSLVGPGPGLGPMFAMVIHVSRRQMSPLARKKS